MRAFSHIHLFYRVEFMRAGDPLDAARRDAYRIMSAPVPAPTAAGIPLVAAGNGVIGKYMGRVAA